MFKGHGEAGCVERVMTLHSSWLTLQCLFNPFVRFLLMIDYDRVRRKLAGNVRLPFFLRSPDDAWRRTEFGILGKPNRQEVLSNH